MLSARFHPSLDSIDADAWDALVNDANPFVSHAFLAGLEQHGCIRAEWGWQAHHLGLYESSRLVAAAPVYLKHNTHGEYVFDWSWAHAWERAGGQYYPKLLCAVPYSPVPGPRLLTGNGPRSEVLRRQLVAALVEECDRLRLSSAHANFISSVDIDAFDPAWLSRFDLQYHWHNHGYRDFEDFLGALRHKKRKNIHHERTQVAQAQLDCCMQRGDTLSAREWREIHALYLHTFDDKGNHAALSLEFLRHLAANLGDAVQVALARRNDVIIAMALFLRGGDTLYGRYWGSREDIPSLHFELCYYVGIEYCVSEKLAHFEPGAQGRHKMARGFVPTQTHSRHYLANPAFRDAVNRALRQEALEMTAYADDLRAHSPYAHD